MRASRMTGTEQGNVLRRTIVVWMGRGVGVAGLALVVLALGGWLSGGERSRGAVRAPTMNRIFADEARYVASLEEYQYSLLEPAPIPPPTRAQPIRGATDTTTAHCAEIGFPGMMMCAPAATQVGSPHILREHGPR